ncbi:hypothetical protein AB0901_19695 [Streptomyces roseifaciens]
MFEHIRRAVTWTRQLLAPTTPREHPATEVTSSPPKPPHQPSWHQDLTHAEETSLVRLYVLTGGEQARLRLQQRWRPLPTGRHGHQQMAEAC